MSDAQAHYAYLVTLAVPIIVASPLDLDDEAVKSALTQEARKVVLVGDRPYGAKYALLEAHRHAEDGTPIPIDVPRQQPASPVEAPPTDPTPRTALEEQVASFLASLQPEPEVNP